MKLKPVIALGLVLLSIGVQAQDKFYTKNARVSFFSDTPLEDIEAKSKTTVAVLDKKAGTLQFSLLIKGFEFENEEMQEHFNEHYLESDKFPKSEFKGQIINNAAINYNKPGSYPAQVKGQLTIHGVTRDVQTAGVVKVEGSGLSTTSTFNIAVADYGIKIPSLVKDKIAKSVKITVDAKLDPLK